MKKQKILSMSAVLLIVFVLMGGCAKDEDPALTSGLTPGDAQLKGKPKPMKTVNLRHAANFAILTKSGITDVYPSAVTGDVGVSPYSGTGLLLVCDEVTGHVYTVDAAGPLPCRITNATLLTTAVADMETAYADAAGRELPDFLNLGAGTLNGNTLTEGLYNWGTAVTITGDITINGSGKDIFIFQVNGTLNMDPAVNIILSGGAKAKNIFWQVTGAVTLGTTSHFEGTILAATMIAMNTGASINGRLLAQTAATLQMNTVVKPR
jgi:hypothetical protein